MMENQHVRKPILFACAGCSNAGRAAYDVALNLQQRGAAEMSCLAGVAAGKSVFLNKLKDREVWVVDGCPIHCALGVFERAETVVDRHVRLHDFGVKKNSDPPGGLDTDRLSDQVLASLDLPV